MIISLFIVASRNTWFIIWFGLELNLICFVPIITSNTNKYITERAIKYFLIQRFRSIILFVFIVINHIIFIKYNNIILILLIFKLGAAPFHGWFILIIERIKWNQIFLLITLQKFNILILISYLLNIKIIFTYIIIFISISAFIGSILGLNQSSLRKIIGYSSIKHLRWILSSFFISKFYWVMYFRMYILIIVPVFFFLFFFQLSNISIIIKELNYIFGLLLNFRFLSLRGLPPFSGFMLKLIVLKEFICLNNILIFLILILSVYISLFYYFRIIIYYFLISSFKHITYIPKKKIIIITIINIIGIIIPYIFFL